MKDNLEEEIKELQDYIEKSLSLISMNVDTERSKKKFMKDYLEIKIFGRQYHSNPECIPNSDRKLVKKEK
jgi:hypothetical protein